MLAFVLLILVAFIISATVIWLWRMIANPHGYARGSLVSPTSKTRVRLKTQQGFMPATARNSKGKTKAPWGW
jgi:NhaP-type Na+/H+ or K+/H+ antiporter